MELQHLKTFLAVIASQSLTRAAEQLHLSQPAVSAHVRSLEQALGVSLFHRTGRGMKLTAHGEEVKELAQEVVAQARRLERRAAELRNGSAGSFRLGTIDCALDLSVAKHVGQLRRTLPELQVDIVLDNSGTNIQKLLDRELDLAFAEGAFSDGRLESFQVGITRVGIIAPAAWRGQLRAGDWEQLAQFPWVFQSDQCSHFKFLKGLAEKHRVTFRPEFRADLLGAIAEIVAQGLALSVAELRAVEPWIARGEVFVWSDFEAELSVSLVCLKARRDDAAIRKSLQLYGCLEG